MLELDITDDQATLSVAPSDDATDAFSVESVLTRLNEAGVVCGILQDAIDNAVTKKKHSSDGCMNSSTPNTETRSSKSAARCIPALP
ncbi:MAG: hypothetical protein E2O52_00330 [Gammaproteobacteria bacterium]|nr:MAG: hypothetical protein E2O52_00330 [Gammaproteobacteria bacterium]